MMDDEDYSHIVPRNCSHCNNPIPLARLDALPDTRYCTNCVDAHGPRVYHDPEVLCAKSSPSGQNGFAPKS